MTDYYPLSIVVHGIALNITVQSHVDQLCFGLIACRRAVPDVHELGSHLQRAMATLRALVGPALAAAAVAAKAASESASAPAERATPARAKRRPPRVKAEPARAPRQPRLRVVAPGTRAPAATGSATSAKSAKAAKPRKARPLADAR
jgi:hypothetical protein